MQEEALHRCGYGKTMKNVQNNSSIDPFARAEEVSSFLSQINPKLLGLEKCQDYHRTQLAEFQPAEAKIMKKIDGKTFLFLAPFFQQYYYYYEESSELTPATTDDEAGEETDEGEEAKT